VGGNPHRGLLLQMRDVGGLHSHRRVVVGFLAAAVAVATVWMLLLGSTGATIASVLAFPVTVAALLVALVEAQAKSVSNDRLLVVARQLARDVRSQEAGALARLMADSGDPEPADVSFAQPTLIYWRADGGDREGTLSEVAGYYRSLVRGRLVVLGEPGAGKRSWRFSWFLTSPQWCWPEPRARLHSHQTLSVGEIQVVCWTSVHVRPSPPTSADSISTPGRRKSSAASSLGRRASLPDAVSRKIRSHPAAVSASRCASVFWSLVLIRPYPTRLMPSVSRKRLSALRCDIVSGHGLCDRVDRGEQDRRRVSHRRSFAGPDDETLCVETGTVLNSSLGQSCTRRPNGWICWANWAR
jgi:hypothetical protein